MFAVSKIKLAATVVLACVGLALTGCSNPFADTKPATAKERGVKPLPQEPAESQDTLYPVLLPGEPLIDGLGLVKMKKEVASRADKCDGDEPAGVQPVVPSGYVRVVTVNQYKNPGRYDTYCITQQELDARRAKRAEWIKVYEGEFEKYRQGHPSAPQTDVAVDFWLVAGMEPCDSYYRYVAGKHHYDEAMSQQETGADDKRPLSYWNAAKKADPIGIVNDQVILCDDWSVEVYVVP